MAFSDSLNFSNAEVRLGAIIRFKSTNGSSSVGLGVGSGRFFAS